MTILTCDNFNMYMDDEEPDRHLEEEDDARDKCCYCIPTAPKDQVQ